MCNILHCCSEGEFPSYLSACSNITYLFLLQCSGLTGFLSYISLLYYCILLGAATYRQCSRVGNSSSAKMGEMSETITISGKWWSSATYTILYTCAMGRYIQNLKIGRRQHFLKVLKVHSHVQHFSWFLNIHVAAPLVSFGFPLRASTQCVQCWWEAATSRFLLGSVTEITPLLVYKSIWAMWLSYWACVTTRTEYLRWMFWKGGAITSM